MSRLRTALGWLGVRVNEIPDPWDPDTVYLDGYRKGRRDEAAARDITAATFADDERADPRGWTGDELSADEADRDAGAWEWPDAARWTADPIGGVRR